MAHTQPLTAVSVEELVQLLLVDLGLGRVHQIAQRLLVEVVCGDIQSPLILREAIQGRVFIGAGDGNELPHFAPLRLLQLVLQVHNSETANKLQWTPSNQDTLKCGHPYIQATSKSMQIYGDTSS